MNNKHLLFQTIALISGLLLSLDGKAQYYLEDRWPNLKFYQPVGMYTAPDQSKRIFVIEQRGRIKVFKDSGNVAQNDTLLFLNIQSRLPSSGTGSETGLLGLAFHPNFTQNGYAYVNYTQSSPSLRTIVSRFTVDGNNPNRLNPSSEKVLITIPQPASNHNGGSIIFGDDGYLYIALGDGGAANDPQNRSQNKTDLLGKILRIDVNVPDGSPTPYAIPADNPYANNSQGWKKEIATVGMRNPWKISKDPAGSTIWIGDVGQGSFEEVDTFRLGANYGWRLMEGNVSLLSCPGCDTSNYEKPITTYARSIGYSITGGFVYRGSELYKLKGTYFYGDYGTQRIWSLAKDAAGAYQSTQLAIAGAGLSSFGLDNENEMYAVRYSANGGKLMKIRCGPPTPVLTVANPSVCFGDSIVLNAPTGANFAGYKWSDGDTSNRKVFKAPGTYNVQIQSRNTFGCWSYSSNSISVTVRQKPAQPVVEPLVGCLGTPKTITLTGASGYRWSTGQNTPSASFTTNGTYWVLALDPASCKSDTTFFTAQFNSPPATPSIISAGGNVSTPGQSGFTFKWLINGAAVQTGTDTSIQISQDGFYQVIAISQNGCLSDTSEGILITKVDAREVKKELVLTPNPFHDWIEMQWLETFGDKSARIEIYDLKGVLLKKETLKGLRSGATFRLDTQSLPNGNYLIKIESGSYRNTERMVKD